MHRDLTLEDFWITGRKEAGRSLAIAFENANSRSYEKLLAQLDVSGLESCQRLLAKVP